MKTSEQLVDLIDFLQKFAGIRRTVKIQNREDMENDAEHSYQLAMTAWFIVDQFNLDMNRQRLLEYALVHDLVEVYSGDTDPYLSSEEYLNSKAEREEQALKRIKGEFQNFSSMSQAIHKYEAKGDNEAKLIFLLDKILPVVNTYITNHSYYKDAGVTFETWREMLLKNEGKAELEIYEVKVFLDELSGFLQDRKTEIFKAD